MRACIIYDTKRGATTFFADWIKEGFKETDIGVEIKRAKQVETLDYDLFIIGSPIYFEKPMKSVTNFLSSHREALKDKKFAFFVVCMAQLFGKHTENYVRNRYIKSLEKYVPETLINSTAFKGWLKKPNYEEKKKVAEWIKQLIEKLA